MFFVAISLSPPTLGERRVRLPPPARGVASSALIVVFLGGARTGERSAAVKRLADEPEWPANCAWEAAPAVLPSGVPPV